MGKILQILIIENRDLAHAQTFCTRLGEATTGTGSKFAQPGMRTRSPNSCSCRPGLTEDAIQPVLPSSRKREYSRLVFTSNKAISIPFSDILALVFLKIIFFTIFAGNISKLEKKAIVYVHHCLCVLQSRP